MRRATVAWGGAGAALLFAGALGCESPELPGDDDDAADDDGGPPPECEADADCGTGEICDDAQECVAGDRNGSLAEAVAIAYGKELEEFLNTPGDTDFYRVDGTGGDYVVIDTTTLDPEDEEGADTVLRLWDSAGQEIGHNDAYERVSGQGTDAYLITRLAASETSYFSVGDGRAFRGEEGAGGTTDEFRYEVVVFPIDASLVESEPNDEPNDADDWPVTAYATNYTHTGAIGSVGDVDWWRVDAELGAMVRVYLFPDVGSRLTPLVTVWAPGEDGAPDPIAEYDALNWQVNANLPVLDDDGYVLISVEDPSGTAGADHFYVLQLAQDDPDGNNVPEVEPNDTLLEATDADLEVDGNQEEGYFVGRIGAPGDVDLWYFEADAGDAISVAVGGRVDYGSSLRPYVRLRDAAGDEVTGGAVNDAEDPAIDAFEVEEGGTYYVEVSSDDPDDAGAAYFYLMGVFREL